MLDPVGGLFADRERISGTQSQPPDRAVVPPNTACFSMTMTAQPKYRAVMAADRPPAPEPTTSTSHETLSIGPDQSRAADSRPSERS